MNTARFISFWTGFCSLSLEIAWIRLYGYANQSTPRAFAYVLIIYLVGIAAGAQLGKKICQRYDTYTIKKSAVLALALCAPVASISPWLYLGARDYALDDLAAPIAIFLSGASFSVLFPITHHLGTLGGLDRSSDTGKHFSRVYLLNVIGAAMGPLVTGYILLDWLTITEIFPVISLLIAVIAIIAWNSYKIEVNIWKLASVGICLTTSIGFGYISWNHPDTFAREFAAAEGRRIVSIHEGRHGIIAIAEEPESSRQPFTDYIVYGGNVYDGKTNVNLERNTNGLERPLALHVLQPTAKNVLVLGLSIGSWLTVIEGFPGIEEIDVIEINPGYLQLARNFDAQRRALEDPRVKIYVDDARRWLQYHHERKYDLILMNTTWHWRANSSMLLSQEMMKIVNRHLSDRGVLAFNATGSIDAFYTASTVFKEVRRYQNFIYGSNWNPFDNAGKPEAWNSLYRVSVDGDMGFLPNSKAIDKYSKIPFARLKEDLDKINRPPEVITDNNMLVEYKYGRKK